MSADSGESTGTNQLILGRRDAFAAARDMYLTVVLGGPDINRGLGEGFYDRGLPVFVQYLNPEVLACYGLKINGKDGKNILENALRATRLAILATDQYLVFPSSYIFEVAWFGDFLAAVEPLVADDHIRYTAPVSDLADYRDIKMSEYRRDRENPYAVLDSREISRHGLLAWTPRPGRSTAIDIGDQWQIALAPGGSLHGLVRTIAQQQYRRYAKTERALERIPERLDGQAFIKRFVEAALPGNITPTDANSLAFFLSGAYLESYVTDLNAMMLIEFPIGDLSCDINRSRPSLKRRLVSARLFDDILKWLGLHEYVHRRASWDELVALRSTVEFRIITSAVGNGFAYALTFAILAARKTPQFRAADSYPQALANLAAVADGIIAIVDQPLGKGNR